MVARRTADLYAQHLLRAGVGVAEHALRGKGDGDGAVVENVLQRLALLGEPRLGGLTVADVADRDADAASPSIDLGKRGRAEFERDPPPILRKARGLDHRLIVHGNGAAGVRLDAPRGENLRRYLRHQRLERKAVEFAGAVAEDPLGMRIGHDHLPLLVGDQHAGGRDLDDAAEPGFGRLDGLLARLQLRCLLGQRGRLLRHPVGLLAGLHEQQRRPHRAL